MHFILQADIGQLPSIQDPYSRRNLAMSTTSGASGIGRSLSIESRYSRPGRPPSGVIRRESVAKMAWDSLTTLMKVTLARPTQTRNASIGGVVAEWHHETAPSRLEALPASIAQLRSKQRLRRRLGLRSGIGVKRGRFELSPAQISPALRRPHQSPFVHDDGE